MEANRLTARLLGERIGVTAETFNVILQDLGYIEGSPNEYSLTEMGKQIGEYKDMDYYTMMKYDPSVLDEITEDMIVKAREKVRSIHKARGEALRAERAAASERFLKEQAEKMETLAREEKWETTITEVKKKILIAGGIVVIGYGLYKITPKLKEWWNGRKRVDNDDDNVGYDNQ